MTRRTLKKILSSLLIALCLLQLGSVWIPRAVSIKGRQYRNIAGIASAVNMRSRRIGKFFICSGASRNLRLELSHRRMYWNGMTVMLGYPVLLHNGGIYVSESDWQSTLKILFFPASVPRHPIGVITLDAGHGGNDQGAAGKYSLEKSITLKLTQRVAALLRACRYRVHLTRSSDTAVALKTRTAMQRARKSDLFVSIHVNAAKNKKVHGIETYCLTPAHAPSTNGKFELKRNPANRFDSNNFALARNLQYAMLVRTGAWDRGVKRARFAVLRDITSPGVLLEIGFISNPAEERKLNNPAYLEKLARGIAQGIIAYHRDLRPRR